MPYQLALFPADSRPPGPADLEGLLAGPVRVDSFLPLRLTVLLDDPARVVPLSAEVGLRGARVGHGAALSGGSGAVPADAGGTALVVELADPPLGLRRLAEACRGSGHAAPCFRLDGGRLRLWCLAAGRSDPAGYRLGLGEDATLWPAIGAALSAAGLPATLLSPAAPGAGGGPAYRLVGSRRVRRLCQLAGDPPEGLPDGYWPLA